MVANWLIFVVALLVGLLVAWWLFGHAIRGGAPRERAPDVLDEGAAPAQRNQALIDAPSAASFASPATLMPPPMSIDMAGIGEAVMIGAQEEANAAAAAGVKSAAAHDAEVAAAAAAAPPDDLTRIKGVGPKLQAALNALGITRYAQIAGWSEADIARIDPQLGAFQGRIARDNWIEQCRYLAAGDTAGFEGKFGKL
ncbi:MAG: hypothetical protein JF593_12530 [Novosphingobium sp.]|nr:hypothetical protein [Novosphingobium sp.]